MSYQWEFADDTARRRLGETPERLAETGIPVKRSEIREVLSCGEFFWKQDFRGGRHMTAEWNGARLVKTTQIPCVEYLAFGRSRDCGNAIVTAALPNAVSAFDYWYQNMVFGAERPERFLDAFTNFVRTMLNSGIFHPDFHMGNILYTPDNHKFTLVDVDGVRRAGTFDRIFRRYRMQRTILECRRILSDEEMCARIAQCGIPHPAEFLNEALPREAKMLAAEWPKRQKQILNDYPKFTERDNGGVLFALTPGRTRRTLKGCAVLEDSPERLQTWFLAHFYLDLALIEHRNIVAWDIPHNRLYWESQVQLKNITTPKRFARLKNTTYALHSEEFWRSASELIGRNE